VGFQKYTMKEEDEYTNACIDHRKQFGLTTQIDLDCIDCESECLAHNTCPLNSKRDVV